MIGSSQEQRKEFSLLLKVLILRLAMFVLAFSFGSAAAAGEGLVALQTADACCPSGTGRYVDCGNGTVTDNETGLIWLKNANCFGEMGWFAAMAAVADWINFMFVGFVSSWWCGAVCCSRRGIVSHGHRQSAKIVSLQNRHMGDSDVSFPSQ